MHTAYLTSASRNVTIWDARTPSVQLLRPASDWRARAMGAGIDSI
jgi:hypothetical protein